MAEDNTSLGGGDVLGLLAMIAALSSRGGNLTGTSPGTYSQTGGLTAAGQALWDNYKNELSGLGDAKGYNLISKDKYGNQVTNQMVNPTKMHLLNKMAGISKDNTQKLGYQGGNIGSFAGLANILAGLGPGYWDKFKNLLSGTSGNTSITGQDVNWGGDDPGTALDAGSSVADTSTAVDAYDPWSEIGDLTFG
jgi:hypothetical protein